VFLEIEKLKYFLPLAKVFVGLSATRI